MAIKMEVRKDQKKGEKVEIKSQRADTQRQRGRSDMADTEKMIGTLYTTREEVRKILGEQMSDEEFGEALTRTINKKECEKDEFFEIENVADEKKFLGDLTQKEFYTRLHFLREHGGHK